MGFSLTDNGSNLSRILDSTQLQTIVAEKISEENFWDLGVPKGSSEFLVYGSAFSQNPVHGLGIFVRVANISKFLMVFGDREWTNFGISKAKPFKVMPIDYEHAFGGDSITENPLGKGTANSKVANQLPNVENPDNLIISKEDIPPIAGFKPYPYKWPQRQQYFLEHGEFNMDSEIIPENILPDHFNTAPHDQRFEGFFIGNEEIEIKNMHPFTPLIKSSLPGIKLRMFVVQQNDSGKNEFHEMPVTCETLFLLPEWERGILIFRATTEIADLNASKVSYIYSALEVLTDQPKSLEHYYQEFISRFPENISASKENNHTITDKILTEENNLNLESLNISDGQSSKEEIGIKAFFAILNNLQNMNFGDNDTIIKNLFGQLSEALMRSNISETDFMEFIANQQATGEPILPSSDEVIDNLKEVWEKDHSIYEQLKHSLDELEKVKKILLDK